MTTVNRWERWGSRPIWGSQDMRLHIPQLSDTHTPWPDPGTQQLNSPTLTKLWRVKIIILHKVFSPIWTHLWQTLSSPAFEIDQYDTQGNSETGSVSPIWTHLRHFKDISHVESVYALIQKNQTQTCVQFKVGWYLTGKHSSGSGFKLVLHHEYEALWAANWS